MRQGIAVDDVVDDQQPVAGGVDQPPAMPHRTVIRGRVDDDASAVAARCEETGSGRRPQPIVVPPVDLDGVVRPRGLDVHPAWVGVEVAGGPRPRVRLDIAVLAGVDEQLGAAFVPDQG